MYDTDDLIQLSALQHIVFCPRQCALIHNEQVWSESMLTAEGRLMHERVHEEKRESRRDVRIEYGVPLRSLSLGIIGKADVIEFHRLEDNSWVPYPVEYKRGKPKKTNPTRSSSGLRRCASKRCWMCTDKERQRKAKKERKGTFLFSNLR
jgi:CRISPR-associated exonuclease Cas4